LQTQVLIIGGGATGTAVARDLALRGVKCILVEKDDINAGASGGNHGLLHSGGRYVSNDQEAARECREEGEIIKKLAPQCIQENGGLFVAVEGDDEKYIADFPEYCNQCDIPVEKIGLKEAREMEPLISEKIIGAYRVQDASVDPFKLSLENINHAQMLGATLLRRTEVTGFEISNKKIKLVHLKNKETGESFTIEPEEVVSASGAWAQHIAGLADIKINMIFSKGSLVITNNRMTKHIINRLRPPSDADIVVPGGVVSIIGTTSTQVDEPDGVYPTVAEVNRIIDESSAMIPVLESIRYIRAFSGVRPLVSSTDSDGGGRNVSRGFVLIDHGEDDVENFTTITSGKLTTFRLMAEKTADLVCQHLGVKKACLTKIEPLPTSDSYEWTEPGLTPREWLRENKTDDIVFCECEMVSKGAIDLIVDSLHKNNERAKLVDIGFRSRLGRGTCQGSFCGARTTGYLYDRDEFRSDEGLHDLKDFFQERWKGVFSILWSDQLIQAELMEAMHCGHFSLEMNDLINKGMK